MRCLQNLACPNLLFCVYFDSFAFIPCLLDMVHILKTNAHHTDFQTLIPLLDKELSIVNGDADAFFVQFNQLHDIRHAIVYYIDDKPVGCGAFKKYDEKTVEIKRMFVLPAFRGKGIALQILQALELWAGEEGFEAFILETSQSLPSAIALYQKAGYHIIPNYGQYTGVESSVCLGKK